MIRCSVCRDWGSPPTKHIHLEEEIEGLLEQIDFQRTTETKYFEEMALENGSIIYRYFSPVSDIGIISSSQKLASKAHCLCANCLRYNLSFVPHYGDGAYCTTNESLKNEHPRIFHSHGIDIRDMNFRAILKIKDVTNFKKFKNTAGVVRSTPIGQELEVGQLVFTDENAVKVIGFQKWDGNSWIDVILDELKGVS
jgi:hypothetical protein